MKLDALKRPFPAEDIEWRVGQCGLTRDGKPWAMVLAYVDARAVQDRLDEVVGQENWQDKYDHLEDGVLCTLSIRINGEWISKQNGSPETKTESFKGGISKALVRCASTWGIGRYLYKLPRNFATILDSKTKSSKMGEVKANGKSIKFFWEPPSLPGEFLPKENIPKEEIQKRKLNKQNEDVVSSVPRKTKNQTNPIKESVAPGSLKEHRPSNHVPFINDLVERALENGWTIKDIRQYMVKRFTKDKSEQLTTEEILLLKKVVTSQSFRDAMNDILIVK